MEAALLACDGPRILLRHLPCAVRQPRTDPAGPPVDPSGYAGGTPPGAASFEAAALSGGTPFAAAQGSPAGPPPVRTRGFRYSFLGSAHEERRRIAAALEACRGNKTRAAEMLGMARNTLRAKLREPPPEPADAPAVPGD